MQEVDRDPLLPQVTTTAAENMATTKAKDDDYVTATLDTDPHQISNDNEVYLTRRMAQELKDEHGFRLNTFGYRYNRAVAVTCKRGVMGKKNIEYLGYLREMRDTQIRVWYPTLKQSDWLVVGSRRLRLLTPEEEKMLEEEGKNMELLLQQPPPQSSGQEKEKIQPDAASPVTPSAKRRKGNSRSSARKETSQPATRQVSQQKVNKGKSVDINASKASLTVTKSINKVPSQECTSQFTTTGAFATRRAMRQLQDEHGFVPNPYGYYNNQPIEVLNTRTAKGKFFWERGHLVGMKPGYVKVRYDGWSDIYDEWFMVGSRKIRPASTETNEASSSSATTTTATGNEAVTATGGDLLCLEDNPELRHEKRPHRLIGPEDYLQLGYLVPIVDPPPPPPTSHPISATSKSTHVFNNENDDDDDDDAVIDNDDDEDYTCKKRIGRRQRKRQTSATSSRVKRRRRTKAQPKKQVNEKDEDGEWEEQVFPSKLPISTLIRRGRPVDDDNHGFIANVYGYDYMQHVQVLHLDKKWYEARLVKMERNMVRVHFCGWIDKFDEYIRVGSRRIQVIENDHEVECIEPFYKERYESAAYQQCQHDNQVDQERAKAAAATAAELAQKMAEMRRSRRRTLENMPTEEEGSGDIDVDGKQRTTIIPTPYD